MRIAIGSPGNGALLKDAIEERLVEDERVSDLVDLSMPDITYPEVSFQVAQAVAEGWVDRGLLICGTGVGTAIAANKVPGVRAATAHDLITVRGSVENYDAQILCMGQNVIAAPAAWVAHRCLARPAPRPGQQLRPQGRRDRGLRGTPSLLTTAPSSGQVPMALSAASTCMSPIRTSSRSLSTRVSEVRPAPGGGARVQIGYKGA